MRIIHVTNFGGQDPMATRRPLSDKNYEDRKPPARTTKKRQQFQTINKSSLLLILNDILKETAKVHGPLILCDEDLQRPDVSSLLRYAVFTS